MTWAADDPERASRGGWVFNSPEPVFGKNDLRCEHSIILLPAEYVACFVIHTQLIHTILFCIVDPVQNLTYVVA